MAITRWTRPSPQRIFCRRACSGTFPAPNRAVATPTTDEDIAMTKGKETKKDVKKKPEKSLMEKRAAKKAKKQNKG